jgi:hypothetical protein
MNDPLNHTAISPGNTALRRGESGGHRVFEVEEGDARVDAGLCLAAKVNVISTPLRRGYVGLRVYRAEETVIQFPGV